MQDKLLAKILDKLDTISETQARHGAVLEEHIRRTEIAETRIDRLDAKVEPIARHVAFFGAAAKVLASLGTLVGIAAGLIKLLG